MGSRRRGSTRKWRINQTCKKLITLHLYNMNKILVCVIQVKYTASISNKVNGIECDISVFFAIAYCSVVEFERSGIVFYQSLEEPIMTVLTWNVILILLCILIHFLRSSHNRGVVQMALPRTFFLILRRNVFRCSLMSRRSLHQLKSRL